MSVELVFIASERRAGVWVIEKQTKKQVSATSQAKLFPSVTRPGLGTGLSG